MAIQVQYDIVFREGGSPRRQSFRGSRRGAPNSGAVNLRLLAPADATQWQTPCGQNRLDGYVTITGEADFYGVVVNVSGAAIERGRVTGTGTVRGGLSWNYADDKGTIFANGHLNATALPAAPTVNTTPVASAYSMVVPAGQRTKVCTCAIAGGLRISPQAGAFVASVEVTLSLMYVLQFTEAYLNLDEAFQTVRVPFVVAPDVRVIRGPTQFIDEEAFFSRARAIRVDEEFQDPALRLAIGTAGEAEARLGALADELQAESAKVWPPDLDFSDALDDGADAGPRPPATAPDSVGVRPRRRRTRDTAPRRGGGR